MDMVRYLFLISGGVVQRRNSIAVSKYYLTDGWRSFSSSVGSKKIGTHSGKFHSDEALGCFMIRRTKSFYNSEVIRTRDPMVLSKLDALLDVGGIYDSTKVRYDHHQKGFEEVFGNGFETKFSSAGLVYKHYGKEIISKEVKLNPDHPDLQSLFVAVYKNSIEAVDAIDNGIRQYNTDKLPRFVNNTSLSSRVERLNLDWMDQDQSPEKEDEAFQQAMELAGNELLECINFHAKSWLPARSVVMNSLLTRKNVDPSGEIIVLTHSIPWKLHIFELEKDMKITPSIKYVLYPDDRREK